jgi:hypothetical protein
MSCSILIGLACLTGAFTATLDINPVMQSAAVTLPDGARVAVFQSRQTNRPPLALEAMPRILPGAPARYWLSCTALRCRYILAETGDLITTVDIEPLPGRDMAAVAAQVRILVPVQNDAALTLADLKDRQADNDPPRATP